MSIRKINLSLAIFLSLLFLLSCESSDICTENIDAPVRFGFYDSDNNDEVVTIDSLSIFGIGHEDSLIYNNSKNVSRVELPLRIANDTTTFVFIFPEKTDTIEVIYDRKVTLISVGCGFTTFYNLNKINHTENEIISIITEEKEVINNLNEHIKIFVPFTPDVE